MEIKVIRKSEQKTAKWSGGTTTQLYIYPENSDYAKKDFLFRISSARVDVPESTFTSLPGVTRELMILEGTMTIYHEGHHSKHLKPFEKDNFLGDWKTTSKGVVTDYNLMCRKNSKGSSNAINLLADQSQNFQFNKEYRFECFYVFNGTIEILIKEERLTLYQGDLVIFSNCNQEHQVGLSGTSNSSIIHSQISLD